MTSHHHTGSRLGTPLRRRRRLERIVAALVVCGVALVAVAAPASAHRENESYLYLDVGEADLRGNVQLFYPDVRTLFGIELAGSEAEVRAQVDGVIDEILAYVQANASLSADGVDWALTFDGYELFEKGAVGESDVGHLILPFLVDYGGGPVPERFEATFAPFVDEIDQRKNIVLISNDWKRGVIAEEANELIVLDSGTRSGSIDLGNSSQWRNFEASIGLGVDHIKTGPDHIFFVLVLLLPSALMLRAMRWEPSQSFGASLWHVLKIATMFTIAHSITFTLAGLDLLPLPPSKLVEVIIALSIAAAALHNLKPVLGHREWAIAFAFGLFHGMGFAGFVEDLQVTNTTKLVSLLGRNVGIEIGQAVIILITFPTLFVLSRTRFYRPFFLAGTSVLAGVSMVWVVERLAEADLRINEVVDKVIYWPRSLVVCLFATLAVGVLYLYERQAGRLALIRAGDTTER